jgi:hypothetical protein
MAMWKATRHFLLEGVIRFRKIVSGCQNVDNFSMALPPKPKQISKPLGLVSLLPHKNIYPKRQITRSDSGQITPTGMKRHDGK